MSKNTRKNLLVAASLLVAGECFAPAKTSQEGQVEVAPKNAAIVTAIKVLGGLVVTVGGGYAVKKIFFDSSDFSNLKQVEDSLASLPQDEQDALGETELKALKAKIAELYKDKSDEDKKKKLEKEAKEKLNKEVNAIKTQCLLNALENLKAEGVKVEELKKQVKALKKCLTKFVKQDNDNKEALNAAKTKIEALETAIKAVKKEDIAEDKIKTDKLEAVNKALNEAKEASKKLAPKAAEDSKKEETAEEKTAKVEKKEEATVDPKAPAKVEVAPKQDQVAPAPVEVAPKQDQVAPAPVEVAPKQDQVAPVAPKQDPVAPVAPVAPAPVETEEAKKAREAKEKADKEAADAEKARLAQVAADKEAADKAVVDAAFTGKVDHSLTTEEFDKLIEGLTVEQKAIAEEKRAELVQVTPAPAPAPKLPLSQDKKAAYEALIAKYTTVESKVLENTDALTAAQKEFEDFVSGLTGEALSPEQEKALNDLKNALTVKTA